jgi:hypothetical protein
VTKLCPLYILFLTTLYYLQASWKALPPFELV